MWIESHTSLRYHPKTNRLARLLGIDRMTAVGLLHYLWWWAMEFAQDGDLSKYDACEVAEGIDWEGDPEKLMAALLKAGFLDEGPRIHDWAEYGEKLHRRRKANAERMRKKRAAEREETARVDDVTDMCSARAEHVSDTCIARGQDRTGQDRQDMTGHDKEEGGPESPTLELVATTTTTKKKEEFSETATRLALFAAQEVDSESTTAEYARVIQRHLDRGVAELKAEKTISELAGWWSDRPKSKQGRTHAHRSLQTWLLDVPAESNNGKATGDFDVW